MQPPGTQKLCLRPGLGNAFVVYLEPRKRVWWLELSLSSAGGANSVLPNLLAGFEGPVRGGAKRGGKEKKKRDGRDVVAVTIVALIIRLPSARV